MKKTILIVESPGKVENIQKYLGDTYEVIASFGHINELAKSGRYGIGVNPLNKFEVFYTLMPDKVHFLDKIISNSDNIDRIILATDEDLEGEAIAHAISENVKHLNKPIFRAHFHEITKFGIEDGISRLTQINELKCKAQQARRSADRIVGFLVSPFLINKFSTKLSAGRVQSVATRIITEREQDITKFKPQEYWNISANLTKDKQFFIAKYTGKVKSQEVAEKIKSELEQPNIQNSIFQTISIIKKPKKEGSPPPLTTSKMQQVMASQYGIEGEQTMQAAQQLYEMGHITYMRTDSVRISDIALVSAREWLTSNKFDIPVKPNTFSNKDKSQDAHECIRPTNINNAPAKMNLAEDMQLLYKTIWTYFVSSQMPPAIYDTLDVKIIHPLSKHQFRLTGKLLVSAGYLALLENRNVSTNVLPSVNNGDQFYLQDDKSIILEQKFTQPPARFTYASLIKELENKGVGRPSTFTTIVSTILNRGYISKKDNVYYGTEMGEKITELLKQYFDFLQYDFTSDLEMQMDKISIGEANYLDVLNEFYDKFSKNLQSLVLENGGKICPKCNSPMYLRTFDNASYWQCALSPFCRDSKIYTDIPEKIAS